MGIYDRDYFRPARPARSFPLPRTVVVTLIAINVAVWIAELICQVARLASQEICWPPTSTRSARPPSLVAGRHADPPLALVAVSHGGLHPRARHDSGTSA